VAAGVKKIVYVSTVGYFGNTKGRVVDESHVREDDGNYLSCYDETKLKAHAVAKDRIVNGAPVVIAQPGGVYGPGDQSEVGSFVRNMATGKLRFKSFPDTGFNMGHVDDIADGIILAHDKGKVGESYVLGGEISTLGELVDKVAKISNRKPIKLTMPAWAIKASVPVAPLVTKMMGLPPNLRELIKTSDGVTYWATDAKARRELGYSPRSLEQGLRDMLAAEKV
jgi:dihydroflavonol-4-reductase